MSSSSLENEADLEIEACDLADEVVTIRRGELEELRACAQDSSSARRDNGPKAEEAAKREEALARELEGRDRKVAELESAYRRSLCDRELATTLAGRPLVSGAAGQLIKLWSDELDVYQESGEYKVVSRDGRPVSQWVAERLGGPEFAHFCLPSSRGGSGARGLSQSGAAARVAPSTRTLGEAIISQWRESAAASVVPTLGPAGWGRRG
jgi:hypothetical protein